jgi:hypothetical protein
MLCRTNKQTNTSSYNDANKAYKQCDFWIVIECAYHSCACPQQRLPCPAAKHAQLTHLCLACLSESLVGWVLTLPFVASFPSLESSASSRAYSFLSCLMTATRWVRQCTHIFLSSMPSYFLSIMGDYFSSRAYSFLSCLLTATRWTQHLTHLFLSSMPSYFLSIMGDYFSSRAYSFLSYLLTATRWVLQLGLPLVTSTVNVEYMKEDLQTCVASRL